MKDLLYQLSYITILKHTTLFFVAAAEQHCNVLQYDNNGRGTETWTQNLSVKSRLLSPVELYPRWRSCLRKALLGLRWLPAPVFFSTRQTKGLRLGTVSFDFIVLLLFNFTTAFAWLHAHGKLDFLAVASLNNTAEVIAALGAVCSHNYSLLTSTYYSIWTISGQIDLL